MPPTHHSTTPRAFSSPLPLFSNPNGVSSLKCSSHTLFSSSLFPSSLRPSHRPNPDLVVSPFPYPSVVLALSTPTLHGWGARIRTQLREFFVSSRVSLHLFSSRKLRRGMAAYQRNTGGQHPLAGGIVTSSKRSVGGDPLIDDNAQLWFGTIDIGTPPVPFTGVTLSFPVQNWPSDLVSYTVDFDTGSSDLFVPSVTCDSSCSGHDAYDPSNSSTSRDLGQQFSLAYGDGTTTVSGEEYSDDVTIAGLTVRRATFSYLSP
jgi:hypothetical protein